MKDLIKCSIDELLTERQNAIEAGKWFASKTYIEQHELSDKYFESRNPSLLTIEQVEEMYREETQRGYCIENSPNQRLDEMSLYTKEAFEVAKPNLKQFVKFNESLFKAYIDKFSKEDKIKAFEILFQESKKWDGINNAAPFYMAICRAYNSGKQCILNQKSAQDIGENPEKFFVSSNTYFKKEFGFE